MKPNNIFSLVSAVSAGYKTYVGTDSGAAYPIYCDELKSEIDSFIPSFSQEGPEISVDNGKASVNGFLPDEYLFMTTYDCTMKGGRKEQVLLSAILEPTDVKVLPFDFDVNSKKAVKLASCQTGDAFPSPKIEWLDDQGNVISSCYDGGKLDANDCFVDHSGTGAAKDNRFRSSSVDSNLRAEIDASEKYQCRVVYQKLVDGQSEEAFLDSNFPETGCIAGECSKKIVDIPVDAPTIRDGDNNEELPNPVVDDKEPEAPENVDDAGNGNKTFLVGSVSGIVIIAIIIAVIFYVKKKERNDEGPKYTEGATSEEA